VVRFARVPLAALALCSLVGAVPPAARAQVFLASEPHPAFSIGPLFVVATVTPDLGPVTVRMSWSLTLPPGRRADDLRQDLFLLLPAELVPPPGGGGPEDPTLRAVVESRGFVVLSEGRLPLHARDRAKLGTGAESDATGQYAPFVTFYKKGTVAAQAGVGTFVKIPWTPLMVDPVSLISLTLSLRDLITPKPATWIEELFYGRRHVLTLGAGSPGTVALYSMYLDQREQVVRLARDFSVLNAAFADSDHLRIDEIAPPAATRRPSRVRAGVETVSLPLAASEGNVPQVLRVQFSYFRGRIAWRPILISLLFLVLGNVMGAIMFAKEVGRFFGGRFHVGRRDGNGRERGVIHAPDTLDRIVPGSTTERELLSLCGPPVEEHAVPARTRRTLIYRGTRTVPHRRFSVGWVGTVSHWDVEHHEVAVELESGRVTNVETRVRRARL
jgi:hypothetical protein